MKFLSRVFHLCLLKYCLLAMLIFTSCKHNVDDAYLNAGCVTKKEFLLDSISRSVIHNINDHYYYLSLKPLNNHSDTFFLRTEKSDKNYNKILEFSYFNNSGQIKIYKLPLASNGLILFDKSKERIENFATYFNKDMDWKKLILKLKENNILELPHSNELKGYFDEEPQSIFILEYSNNCRYKALIYPDLKINAKYFGEAKKILSFLAYLKKDFDF